MSAPYATESARVSAVTESLADMALRSPPTRTPTPASSAAGAVTAGVAEEESTPLVEAVAEVFPPETHASLPSSVPLRRFQHLRTADSSSSANSLLESPPSETERTVDVDPAPAEQAATVDDAATAPAEAEAVAPQTTTATATQQQQQHRVEVPASAPLRRVVSTDDVVGTAPFTSVRNEDLSGLRDEAAYSQTTSLLDWAAEVAQATSGSAVEGDEDTGLPPSDPMLESQHSADMHSAGAASAEAMQEENEGEPQLWDAAADVEEVSDRDLVDAEDDAEMSMTDADVGEEAEASIAATANKPPPLTATTTITTVDAATQLYRDGVTGAAAAAAAPSIGDNVDSHSSTVFTISPTSNRLAAYHNLAEVLSLASAASLGAASPLFALSPRLTSPLQHLQTAQDSAYTIQHSTTEEGSVGLDRASPATEAGLLQTHDALVSAYTIQHSEDTISLGRLSAAAARAGDGGGFYGRTAAAANHGYPSDYTIHHSSGDVMGGMMAELVRGVSRSLPEDAAEVLDALGGGQLAGHVPAVVVEEAKEGFGEALDNTEEEVVVEEPAMEDAVVRTAAPTGSSHTSVTSPVEEVKDAVLSATAANAVSPSLAEDGNRVALSPAAAVRGSSDGRPLPSWAASSRTSSSVTMHIIQPATRNPSGLDIEGRRSVQARAEPPRSPSSSSSCTSSSRFEAQHVKPVSRSPTHDGEVAAAAVVAELVGSDTVEEVEGASHVSSSTPAAQASLPTAEAHAEDRKKDGMDDVTAMPFEVAGALRQKRTPVAPPPPPLLSEVFATEAKEDAEGEAAAVPTNNEAEVVDSVPANDIFFSEVGPTERVEATEATEVSQPTSTPSSRPPPQQPARSAGLVSAWTWAAPAATAHSPLHNLLDAVGPTAAHTRGSPSRLPHRPLVARDLLEAVEEMSDGSEMEEEEKEWPHQLSALPSSSAPQSPAAAVQNNEVVALVHRQRNAAAAADRAVLVGLEREGRLRVMADMLAERAAALRDEAAAFAVLKALSPITRAVQPPQQQQQQEQQRAAPAMATSPAAWPRMPPSPLAPTSRQEVQALLRTRGVAGSFSFSSSSGLLSAAAVFTDELLLREVIEDDEERHRTMLRRLHQCEADAFCPSFVYVQEALAWQRLTESERVERQHLHALDAVVNEEVADLLNIGREMALCCMMEEEERHEVVMRAEAAGRQRLYELHWSGVAARLRQSALLNAQRNIAVDNALDDLQFEETQQREEVRVAAIREWTALAESSSGEAVRQLSAQRRPSQHLAVARTAAVVTRSLPQRADTSAAAEEREQEAAVALSTTSSTSLSSSSSLVSSSVSISVRSASHHNEATNSVDVDGATPAAAPAIAAAAPHVFQWDPTSNSNPTPHGSAGQPSQQRQHTSASSPSPHLTNMTTFTTTTTTTTTTTPSSSVLVTGSVDVARLRHPQKEEERSATTESRRSPTLVLPTQAQLVAQEGIGPAEASALLHALRCTEAAVRQERRQHATAKGAAANSAEEDAEAEGKSGRRHRHRQQHTEKTGSNAQDDGGQRITAEEVEDVVDVDAAQHTAAATHDGVQSHPASRRSPLFLTRHSIPCSLRRSPAKAYHALVHRYTSPTEQTAAAASSSLRHALKGAARVLSSPSSPISHSPSSSASTSPRRYHDSDVYAVDAHRPRGNASGDNARARFSDGHHRHQRLQQRQHRLPPWERQHVAESSPETPTQNTVASDAAQAESATPATPAREVFPAYLQASLQEQSSHLLPAQPTPAAAHHRPSPAQAIASLLVGPATPSSPPTRPTLVEVVTTSCWPHALDVSLSPLSSRRTPSRPRPPQHYAVPTAAWVAQVEDRKLDQLRNSLLKSTVEGDDASLEANGRSNTCVDNAAQCGCSRRRLQDPSDPLLITRLPFEEGPGVWPSPVHPRDASPSTTTIATTTRRRGGGDALARYTSPPPQRHVLATTAPGPAGHHETASTLADAVRSGDVVHLPTTVAELLRGPQHLWLSSAELGERDGDREEEEKVRAKPVLARSPASPPVQPARVPYNYVDVFYKQPQRGAAAATRKEKKEGLSTRPASASPLVAARCAAVDQCERQHELRTLLRQPSAPTLKSKRVASCSQEEEGAGAVTQRGAPSAVTNAPLPSSSTTTSTSTTHARASSDVVGDMDAAECFFDDGDVVLCSVLANRVRRERGAARRPLSQHISPPPPPSFSSSASQKKSTAAVRTADSRRAPQRSPPPSVSSPHGSSADPHVFGRGIPSDYRVLRAPSPSYLQVRTPSQPQPQRTLPAAVFVSPTAERVTARHGSRGYAAPTPSTPAHSPIGAVSQLRSSFDGQRSLLDVSGLPVNSPSRPHRTSVW